MRSKWLMSILPLLIIVAQISADASTLKPSVIRTELRVGKSLRPEDTQEIKVRSNDGGTARLIVKKRDSKTSSLVPRSAVIYDPQPFNQNVAFSAPVDESQNELIKSFINHINRVNTGREFRNNLLTLSSMRGADVPEPVVISSDPMDFERNGSGSDRAKRQKSGRSKTLVEVGDDGIPIVEGIRVPDDDEDKVKTWRNGRVINGELVPYEKGYKPKKAIPLTGEYGQLLYVKKFDADEPSATVSDREASGRSFGPFTKFDNFKAKATGPFTVDDNRQLRSANFDENDTKKGSIGPFSVKDNGRVTNSKLIDYIKTINDNENRQRRDFFLAEQKSKNSAILAAQPKIQRRMLENIGEPVYAPSRFYAKQSKVYEGERSPVMEYAHPEYGVKATIDTSKNDRPVQSPKIQYYTQDPAVPAPIAMNKNDRFAAPPQGQYQYPEYRPYRVSYVQKQTEDQPFYMKIAQQMHDGMQNGYAVFIRPIVEAGKQFTRTLGFTGRSMGSPTKTVTTQTETNESQPIGDDLVLAVEKHHGIEAPNKIRTKRLEDSIDSNGHRTRRAIDLDGTIETGENQLQNIENNSSMRLKWLIQNTDWTNTGCAKRVFCEVMIQQSADDIAIMEKKMLTILPSRSTGSNAIRVFQHLSDVTEGIQQRDCSRFTCNK